MNAQPPTVGMRCPQCGAAVQRGATSRTAICAFCETALVAGGGDAPLPGRVVPFRVDGVGARIQLRTWLKARPYAPNAVQGAEIASLRGVLVPFLAFDGVARSKFGAKLGITYETGAGDSRRTHTEWFDPMEGSHVVRWTDHLVSGSRGLPEAVANALEPFDLGEAVPYDPKLLAGVDAELSSVPAWEAETTARAEMGKLARGKVETEQLSGFRIDDLTVATEVSISGSEEVLLPVWIARFRGGSHAFVLHCNGQTGEVVGVVPHSSWKAFAPAIWVGVALGVVVLLVGIAVMGVVLALGILGAVGSVL